MREGGCSHEKASTLERGRTVLSACMAEILMRIIVAVCGGRNQNRLIRRWV